MSHLAVRLRHLWLVLTRLPSIFLTKQTRILFREAQAFLRTLPEQLTKPIPEVMGGLVPAGPPPKSVPVSERSLREIADAAALLDRRSPLGLCLRRSLLRYLLLRRAGLPVKIHFGARFQKNTPDREVTGHAWITLNGAPYYEDDDNWRGFSVMLTFPEPQN